MTTPAQQVVAMLTACHLPDDYGRTYVMLLAEMSRSECEALITFLISAIGHTFMADAKQAGMSYEDYLRWKGQQQAEHPEWG